jgi:hypothetical protein
LLTRPEASVATQVTEVTPQGNSVTPLVTGCAGAPLESDALQVTTCPRGEGWSGVGIQEFVVCAFSGGRVEAARGERAGQAEARADNGVSRGSSRGACRALLFMLWSRQHSFPLGRTWPGRLSLEARPGKATVARLALGAMVPITGKAPVMSRVGGVTSARGREGKGWGVSGRWRR